MSLREDGTSKLKAIAKLKIHTPTPVSHGYQNHYLESNRPVIGASG